MMARSRFSKAAAYHEAAHAVARVRTGAKATAVEIHAGGGGLTRGTGVTEALNQYGVWDKLTRLLAGPYLEARVSKRSRASVMLTNGRDDYAQACELIDWLVRKGYALDWLSAWERAQDETLNLLKVHKRPIARVAKVLLRHGRVTRRQVLQLVR